MSGHMTPFEKVMSHQRKKNAYEMTHYLLKRDHVTTHFKGLFKVYPMVYRLNQLDTYKKIVRYKN